VDLDGRLRDRAVSRQREGAVCPDLDALFAWLAGELDEPHAQALEAHIDDCPQCTAVVAHAARELDIGATKQEPSTESSGEHEHGPSIPHRAGRFVVLGRIGSGGMGVVCSAFDPRLDRAVAIKFLREDRRDADAHARLRREAEALARLSHPNVVTVFECSERDDGEGLFVVMELVQGQTLRDFCRHPSRTRREIVDAYLDAARGLAAAHAAGLVHRDFKPENAFVGHDGRVRVGDFGLARSYAGALAGTQPSGEQNMRAQQDPRVSDYAGTPQYMAPEQRRGVAGPPADQYAWCVSLSAALERFPRVPARLRRALRRGLSERPEDRWPSMDVLIATIERRRSWLQIGIAASVPVAMLAIATSLPDDEVRSPCADAHAVIQRAWDPERRRAIAASANDAASVAALASLDTWVERWRSAATTACVDEPAALAPAGCMTLAAVRFEAFVELLERHAVFDASLVAAARELVATPTCDGQVAIAVVAGDEAAWAAVRTSLAQAQALSLAQRYDGAVSLGAAAVAAAREVDPRLLAEALDEHSELLHMAGDYAAEREAAEEAFVLAERHGLVDLAFVVAQGQVRLYAFHTYDPQAAATWLRRAEVAVSRMDADAQPRSRALLRKHAALLRAAAGEMAPAADEFAALLAMPEHFTEIERTELYGLHANASMSVDDELALASFGHALAGYRARHGDDHETVIAVVGNVASIHFHRGDMTLAAGLFEAAAQRLAALLGDEHPMIASMYLNLGTARSALGDDVVARQWLERSIAIFRRAVGPDDPGIAVARSNLGEIALRNGDLDAAYDQVQTALDEFATSIGTDHPDAIGSLRMLAEIAHRRGQPEQARQWQARAEAIATRYEITMPEGFAPSFTPPTLPAARAEALAQFSAELAALHASGPQGERRWTALLDALATWLSGAGR
jgi:tetratricopeptide (TPR) repeat protein